MPGRGGLNLFLCRQGAGPVSWQRDLDTAFVVDLEGEDAPA